MILDTGWSLSVCQDQDSLLVKRRNDNHSPGPLIRELVPSSHKRSELCDLDTGQSLGVCVRYGLDTECL